jgi:hypothetical protein
LCLLQRTSRVAGLGAAKPGLLVKKRTAQIGLLGNPVAVALVQSVLSVVLIVAAFGYSSKKKLSFFSFLAIRDTFKVILFSSSNFSQNDEQHGSGVLLKTEGGMHFCWDLIWHKKEIPMISPMQHEAPRCH